MNAMREKGLSHILTNDHGFEQEGFSVLIEKRSLEPLGVQLPDQLGHMVPSLPRQVAQPAPTSRALRVAHFVRIVPASPQLPDHLRPSASPTPECAI
jgi:hypothetical protein